jgi:hypothetical protein
MERLKIEFSCIIQDKKASAEAIRMLADQLENGGLKNKFSINTGMSSLDGTSEIISEPD